jgi:hypothetical protein
VSAARARVCPRTGLYLVPARGQTAWRVAKEQYVRSGGILAVRANGGVGPLPQEAPDRRGRFDTIGRTVYFAESAEAAFAEVLQEFRKARVALEADAAAADFSVEEYVETVRQHAVDNGRDVPWAVGARWQMDRCVHSVSMPEQGWWVRVDHRATLDRVGMDLAPHLKDLGVALLTLSNVMGESRAVTTLIAQHIRDQDLFDGSRPLGIEFTSKTGYGTCWAWWYRRADDGLAPGADDPKTVTNTNVDVPAFRKVAAAWDIEVLQGKPQY